MGTNVTWSFPSLPSDTCWKGLVPVVDSVNCKICSMICRPGNIDLLQMRPAADVEMTSVAPIATSAGLSVAKRPLQFCSLVGTHRTTENQHQMVQNKFHVDLGAKKEVGSVCHNGCLPYMQLSSKAGIPVVDSSRMGSPLDMVSTRCLPSEKTQDTLTGPPQL